MDKKNASDKLALLKSFVVFTNYTVNLINAITQQFPEDELNNLRPKSV